MANYTEVKRIIILHESRKGSVLLRWLNPLGNWECWLFQGKTQESRNVTDEVNYLDTEHRNYNTISKQAQDSMILRTYLLDDNQRNGIKTLFTSPIVKATIEGIEQVCTVNQGNYLLYDEMQKKNILQIEINLSRVNSLTQ